MGRRATRDAAGSAKGQRDRSCGEGRGTERREKKGGSEIPRRRASIVDVLVGQADGSKGEHPVHANDIPEVQRAVFRGYQASPWSLPDERVTHGRANAVERKGVRVHARVRVSVAHAHTCAPRYLSLRVYDLRSVRGVFVCRESLCSARDMSLPLFSRT